MSFSGTARRRPGFDSPSERYDLFAFCITKSYQSLDLTEAGASAAVLFTALKCKSNISNADTSRYSVVQVEYSTAHLHNEVAQVAITGRLVSNI